MINIDYEICFKRIVFKSKILTMTDKTVFKKKPRKKSRVLSKRKKIGISKKTKTKKPNNHLTNLKIISTAIKRD